MVISICEEDEPLYDISRQYRGPWKANKYNEIDNMLD